MTVYLDASALLALHVDAPPRRLLLESMESDPVWAAATTALAEAVAGAARLTGDDTLSRLLEDMIRHSWDFLHTVPIDQLLLDEATDLCRRQPVGISTAIHLAAAGRMPAPVSFATFDAAQIPVALSLGFTVISG